MQSAQVQPSCVLNAKTGADYSRGMKQANPLSWVPGINSTYALPHIDKTTAKRHLAQYGDTTSHPPAIRGN